jgi:hypothetical protein
MEIIVHNYYNRIYIYIYIVNKKTAFRVPWAKNVLCQIGGENVCHPLQQKVTETRRALQVANVECSEENVTSRKEL